MEDEKEEGGTASTAYITSHIYLKLVHSKLLGSEQAEHGSGMKIRFTLDE